MSAYFVIAAVCGAGALLAGSLISLLAPRLRDRR